jgi:hypothetical protein
MYSRGFPSFEESSMPRFFLSTILLVAAFASGAALLTAAAQDKDCTRYVPSVGKTVRVPCNDSESAPPPASPPAAATPAAPPPAAAAPAVRPEDDKGIVGLRWKVSKATEALISTRNDAAFRDTYCTVYSISNWVRDMKNSREKENLIRESDALDQSLGERGRWIAAATNNELMNNILDEPIGDLPSPRIRDEPDGKAFIKAGKDWGLHCDCAQEPTLKRMLCCDACGAAEIERRARQLWTR